MSDKDQISSLLHAMYGNATTYHGSPTTEGQGGLLDSKFPSSQTYITNDVDSVIEFLNVCRQRLSDNAEAMGELHHRRQNMMMKPNVETSATLPVAKGGTFLPFTEPGFGGSGLDGAQYHLSQGFGMDILHRADTFPVLAMKVAGQYQAALSHNMQTSMTEINESSLCRDVPRYQEKRTFTPAHATSPQSTDLDGHAPEISSGSARSGLPGQTLNSAAISYTSDNRDGYAKSSVSAPPRIEYGGPTVVSFVSDGINYYRCECGYESARKGDVDRHLESLRHSKRKYECSCGKKFTRYDSLKRHKKRRRNRCQM